MTKKRVAIIRNYYALWQSKKVKVEAIKKACCQLGLKYHPDVNLCKNRKVDNSFAKKKGEADG